MFHRLFPWLVGMHQPRTGMSAFGGYKQIPVQTNNIVTQAFETYQYPPNLPLEGHGTIVGTSGGPQRALFLPQVEWAAAPTTSGLQYDSYGGPGGLFESADSDPAQELF